MKIEAAKPRPEINQLDLDYKKAKIDHYRSILRSTSTDTYKSLIFSYAAALLSLSGIAVAINVKSGGVDGLFVDQGAFWFRIMAVSVVLLTVLGLVIAMIGLYYTFRNAEFRRDELAQEIEIIIYGEKRTILPKDDYMLKISKDLFKNTTKSSALILCLITILESAMILMMFWR